MRRFTEQEQAALEGAFEADVLCPYCNDPMKYVVMRGNCGTFAVTLSCACDEWQVREVIVQSELEESDG